MILHWFRRDLRLEDNPALHAAQRESGGRVLPVFILSDWRGQRAWISPARQAALCGNLRALDAELKALGGCLILRRGEVVAELERLLRETRAEAFYFNRSPDPAGRAQEARVAAMARDLGVRVQRFHEVTVHEPGTVLTQSGQPFRVFTPYFRAWSKLPAPEPGPRLGPLLPITNLPGSLPLPTLADWGLTSNVRLLDSGEPAAQRRMDAFFAEPVFRYGSERDLPEVEATSRFSADLRWGTLSIRAVVARCREASLRAHTAEARASVQKFLGELVWREFYFSILNERPEVLDQPFQERFAKVPWLWPDQSVSAKEHYQRWGAAETGFPIVDAGMRQLLQTGWMHNRVRMIVAMFFTKDLHLHWRAGEQFFMEHLVDGEIASNNGGWQWSAGTGADAAPYFRIQNPWTQSARYDPQGDYIKQWLPELKALPASAFFKPSSTPLVPGYPKPMVDHARERQVALDLFAQRQERFN